MDWGLTANIAAVVVPSVGAVGWVLDMRIQLVIERNNRTMLDLINGKYVRREQLDDKLQVAVTKAHQSADGELYSRMGKVENDMRNMTSSLARRTAAGQ
jgi:hypothetical protein